MDAVSRRTLKKSPDPIDEWLAKEGYYRKVTPKDSTCLFRVVSEQIYLTQHDHLRVRNECVDFMRKNPSIIEKSVSISTNDYLDQMRCFTQWGGDNEIRAMALLYKVDFVVFNASKLTQTKVTNHGFKKLIYLCHLPPKQYDGVYTQEYMSDSAFCQSIVYQTLYKSVFKMTDIDSTVHKMLHERSPDYRHDKFFLKGNLEIRNQLKIELFSKLDDGCDEIDENRTSHLGSAPFPYRVAKALDPQIFRNTDLDVWQEIKREVRNAGWTRFNNDFQIGAKCLVQIDKVDSADKENNNTVFSSEIKDSIDDSKSPKAGKKEDLLFYNGHIQEMSKDEGPVVVYIEELCEKKTVPYAALKPISMLRKSKQNLNWNNNNMPKKNIATDQNQKYKKPWNCQRRTKDLGPNINMSHFDRNNGSRKEGNDSKEWADNSHKNETMMVPDKFKAQNFNTNQNFTEANVNTAPVENCQYPVTENNHRRVCEDEDKKTLQTDVNRNNIHVKNQHYTQANNANNSYQTKPQYTNPENAPITPTVQPINLSVSKSMDINGNDLPYSEPCTLRFFYNLGLEYFHVNQLWNYPPYDQMIAPAYFTSQNPPPLTGIGNSPSGSNGVNMSNEEVDASNDMNRSKMHNMRRKDDGVDRNRNNIQKSNIPRYNKSLQNNAQTPAQDQKNFNRGNSQNNAERKDQNMNKDVQRNNRNGLGPRFRKNDGRNSHMHQMHSQKQDMQHQNSNRYNNGPNKVNGEAMQQVEMEQASSVQQQQQQQFSNAPLYPMPFNQPPIYNQITVCGSEAEAYAGFYPPQANFFPVVYQPSPVGNGDLSGNMDETGYQMFQPYMYSQTPVYSVSGVPENWYPVAGPPTAFVPYGPIVSPNTPNNSPNAPPV